MDSSTLTFSSGSVRQPGSSSGSVRQPGSSRCSSLPPNSSRSRRGGSSEGKATPPLSEGLGAAAAATDGDGDLTAADISVKREGTAGGGGGLLWDDEEDDPYVSGLSS